MDCQMTDFEVGKIRPKIGFSENACMTKNLKLSSRNEWPDQENSGFQSYFENLIIHVKTNFGFNNFEIFEIKRQF